MNEHQILCAIENEIVRQKRTRVSVSDEAGISHATMRKWLLDGVHPRLDLLLDVVDVLGLDIVVTRRQGKPTDMAFPQGVRKDGGDPAPVQG